IRQILLNLLGNATKFTERGGVVLRAAARPAREGLVLEFEVRDTGVGLAAVEMDRLFEPFEQTESGIAAPGGTGLGLAITRELARLLGGEVSATSTPGVGSCFVVTVHVGAEAAPDSGERCEEKGRVVAL